MINKVTLVGNLGRDPEVRRFEGGSAVAKFSVATNENYKDQQGQWQTQTEWHEVVCWGGLAERAERELRKGKLVYIEGKITHRKYTDKNNIERTATEIVANLLRLLDRDRPAGGTEPGRSAAPMEPPFGGAEMGSGADLDQEDLPF